MEFAILLTLHSAGVRKLGAFPSGRLEDLNRTGESLVALQCEESRPGGRSYREFYRANISIALTMGFTIAFAIHSVDRSVDPTTFLLASCGLP